jgi:hypothetical protein
LELQVADRAASGQGGCHRDRSAVTPTKLRAADLILSWAKVHKQNAHANFNGLR